VLVGVLCLGLLVLLLTASESRAAATIGSASVAGPAEAANTCGTYPCAWSQSALPGRMISSPVDGLLTSWSVDAASDGTSVRLRIIRPQGGGLFQLIGASSVRTSLTAGVHSFTDDRPLIDGGDRVAIEVLSGSIGSRGQASPVSGSTADLFEPMPPDLSAQSLQSAARTSTNSGIEYLFNATIAPDNTINLLRMRVNRAGTAAKALVEVFNPGKLKIKNFTGGSGPRSNELIKPTKAALKKAGKFTLRVGLSSETQQAFAQGGHARGKIRLVFTPTYGSPGSISLRVKLRRGRPWKP
jgi:hypothetical protein